MNIDNEGRNQQNLSFIKKILTKFDHIKESKSRITYLPIKK